LKDRDRILILGNYPPPFGGIATHLRGLVPAIEDAGYAVDMLSPSTVDTTEPIGQHSTVHRISKDTRVNLMRVARRPARFVRYAWKTRLFTPQVAKGYVAYDVARTLFERHGGSIKLISTYLLYPWGLAGAMLSEEFGVPLVATNFGEILEFADFYRAHPTIVGRIIRNSSALLASSRHCASMYETSLGIPGVPVQAIPYGVEPVFFEGTLTKEEARRREDLPQDKVVVLFVGRMHAQMGLDTWLKAIELLAADERFHFVIGGAKNHLTPDAEAVAQRWPGRVTVRVNLPFESLPRLYTAADIVVTPSSDEQACMGVTIKEGMASARAVVGSDLGGIREAVVTGVTGELVKAGDPSAFADAIRRLASDPALLAAMGVRGRERALELFTMKGTHDKILAIMERVIRGRPVSAA
jgi:glycosyltransferase involved in cell wall biosynthesis